MQGSKERKQRQLDLNVMLGRRLAQLRRAQKLNQREVAERLDVQRPLISKIENGYHTLDAMEVPDYARALGVAPEVLFQIIGELSLEYDGRTKEERARRQP